MAESSPPRSPTRYENGGWRASILFLATLAVFLAAHGAYWAPLLVLVELFHGYLGPALRGLTRTVDLVRAQLHSYKRFPGALVGIPLLLAGMGLGVYAPDSVSWLGDLMGAGVKGIARAAPYIIFFTLTPAVAGVLSTGKAGKFALWVSLAYIVSTILAGILAILLVIPILGVRLTASGTDAGAAGSLGGELLGLALDSAPFLAIWTSIGLGLMIHGFDYRGLRGVLDLVGGKIIELLGDLLKILLPLILFSLGVFIPTNVKDAIVRAKSEGEIASSTGFVGTLTPEAAYFFTILILILLLALWIIVGTWVVTRYTRFSQRAFYRDYFLDVYSYAWATASSSATIPINLERAGEALKVRRSVREFIIPLGATINLDGTMMGGIVSGVVAAQMVGYTPTVFDLIVLLIPLTIITIGVPGIPGGLAVLAAPVLVSLLPLPPGTEGVFMAVFIGFNLGLSDQFRTGVNAVSNGLLSRLFEYWYPLRFERHEMGDGTVVVTKSTTKAV